MPWHRSDKKHYSGKIESIFVSLTEAWDVENFIDQYLELRGFQVNDMNRDRIALRLEAVPSRPPYRAVQLVAWLDENYTARARASTERSEADARTSLNHPASTTTTAISDRCLVQPRSLTDFDTSSTGDKLNHVEQVKLGRTMRSSSLKTLPKKTHLGQNFDKGKRVKTS